MPGIVATRPTTPANTVVVLDTTSQNVFTTLKVKHINEIIIAKNAIIPQNTGDHNHRSILVRDTTHLDQNRRTATLNQIPAINIIK